MRPEGFKNPYVITPGFDLATIEHTRYDAYEAGADAILQSLLDCGIMSLEQLEALSKNGYSKGETESTLLG